MATRSFTDNYTLTRGQSRSLKRIIEKDSNEGKVINIKKVEGHKEVKGKAILKLLGSK